MLGKLFNWFDDRTGYRALMHDALYENIPGGSRWRYVWGSTLVFTFTIQVITGLVLWMAYSPSENTAWESVNYIQYEMQGGWLLRGIHHFTAQAMVVLLVIHLAQVVIDGAYKAPREVNFWIGLILMQIVLGLSLTGYLLPWDQKGYWATRVATNLMSLVPVVGVKLQQLVVGGNDYNHHTVTRFFALHAGVLPILLVGFLVAHVAVFRRQGICAKPSKRKDQTFWPEQILKDGVACLAVLAAVIFLSVYLGAESSAPADGAREYSAARPEWYFLFLFQFLKWFEGMGAFGEFLGAIAIPGFFMAMLFAMPFFGRFKAGHVFNVVLLFVLLGGAGYLTYEAIEEDLANPDLQNDVWIAHESAGLSVELAGQGIPVEGARHMMRTNPKSLALRTFTDTCLTCHAYNDGAGHGFAMEKATAPNLYGFSTEKWISALLDPKQVDGPHFFGGTGMKEGDMVGFVKESRQKDDGGEIAIDDKAAGQIAAALAAEAGAEVDPEVLRQGRALIEKTCIDCHKFHDEGYLGSAPDLTGYGSREWLIGMIGNPSHERFYGHLEDEQAMPAFGQVKDNPLAENLDPKVIGYLADYLRGELFEHQTGARAK